MTPTIEYIDPSHRQFRWRVVEWSPTPFSSPAYIYITDYVDSPTTPYVLYYSNSNGEIYGVYLPELDKLCCIITNTIHWREFERSLHDLTTNHGLSYHEAIKVIAL